MTNKNLKNVDSWIKNRNSHQVKALENASRIFDNKDALTVNTIEAIFGQETSFGTIKDMGKRGDVGPVGYFQINLDTANRFNKGKVTKTNDPRFDVDKASNIAGLYLAELNKLFSKNSTLINHTETYEGRFTTAIPDLNERKSFVIAAYNAGEGTIAKAQMTAQKDGKDATKWEVVKEYLKEAGATDAKVKEIIEYVEKVMAYEKEFSEKSKANKKLKDKDPKKVSNDSGDGHWVTLDNGHHIFIEGKKSLRKSKK